MIAYERAVRFEEIDAAGIVFFGHFFGWAHEAMESFFDAIAGGYAGIVVGRKVGFPVVNVEASFQRPFRYGDRMRVEVTTARLGNRSAVVRFRIKDQATGELSATLEHTVVTTDLATLTSCPMPDDVRRVLAEHLEVGEAGG